MNVLTRGNRWATVSTIVMALMALEIVYLFVENRKLKAVIEDPKKYFKTLARDDTVPSFSARDIEGKEINVRYSDNSPFTLLFWFSPGCSSCEDDIHFWNELGADYAVGEIRCIGMCVGSPEEARQFADENNIEFPVVCVGDPFILERYKGHVLPQTVFVSPMGKVLEVWPGSLDVTERDNILNSLGRLQSWGEGGES
jgi:peroxiredoxin